MSIIVKPWTFTVGAVIIAAQHNADYDVIYQDYNGNITTANLSASADIVDTQLAQITSASKVSGASLTLFPNIPSSAGLIPTANIPAFSYVKCSNTQTSGTGGGTATSGGWNNCVLNTKDNDTGSIATLSSNQVALPAGTYLVRAVQVFNTTNGSQMRLYNVTDSSVIINGITLYAYSVGLVQTCSHILGQFTISGTKTIAMQYQVQTTVSTTGLGQGQSFGTEVYAFLELTKIG